MVFRLKKYGSIDRIVRYCDADCSATILSESIISSWNHSLMFEEMWDIWTRASGGNEVNEERVVLVIHY